MEFNYLELLLFQQQTFDRLLTFKKNDDQNTFFETLHQNSILNTFHQLSNYRWNQIEISIGFKKEEYKLTLFLTQSCTFLNRAFHHLPNSLHKHLHCHRNMFRNHAFVFASFFSRYTGSAEEHIYIPFPIHPLHLNHTNSPFFIFLAIIIVNARITFKTYILLI